MITFGEKKDTAATYGKTLAALSATHPELVLVECDLMKAAGSAPFKEACPERMFNVGIAEQDALSFAAGLAAMGKTPFVSGFACFVAQRACDQAVSSIAYNDFNVKVVGTYAGLTSERNGGTHISINDMSIYRSIPRFTVIDPGDPNEFAAATRWALTHKGPVYIRSNRGMYPTFTSEDYQFRPDKAVCLSDGADVGLITNGVITLEGLRAVEQLREKGIGVRHIHMPCIKPIDREEIIRTASTTRFLVTAENQTVVGGLGSAVAEVLCEEHPAKLIRLGMQDHFGETALMPYMLGKYEINVEAIVKTIAEHWECRE